MMAKAATLLSKELTTLRVLSSAGIIRPYPPRVLVGIAKVSRYLVLAALTLGWT